MFAVKTNLESPTKPKMKRKNSSEPTMTFHTRAATDEIYDMFNQPLKSENVDNTDSICGSDYEEDGYISAGESTRVSGTTSDFGDDETTEFRKSVGVNEEQDYGDETRADSAGVSEWTEFTSQDVPDVYVDRHTKQQHHPRNGEHSSQIESEDENSSDTYYELDKEQRNLTTPHSSQLKNNRLERKFVPVPPEDYNPPTGPYRNAEEAAQNRLPFMTPIVEQTESSLSSTVFAEKKHSYTKTPLNRTKYATATPTIPEVEDLLLSSPFQEYTRANATEVVDVSEQESPSRLAKRQKPSPERQKPRKLFSGRRVIVNETQCNPIDPEIRAKILRQACPSLHTFPGFHDHGSQTGGYAAEIRKYMKFLTKGYKNSIDRAPPAEPILSFSGAERSYAIKRELGEGGFAAVYLAESVDSPDSLTSDSNTENRPKNNRTSLFLRRDSSKKAQLVNRQGLEAVKVENGDPSAWEFYMIRTAEERLDASLIYNRVTDSIVRAHEMHIFKNEGFLVEDYRCQGTLIDLVNAVGNEPSCSPGSTESGLDEIVAMFFTVELFRIVEGLHACGILHGDIKPDNCLVRFDNPSLTPMSPMDDVDPIETHYSPNGSCGWRNKGITLIDFGRSIDMRAFPESVQFIADWKVGTHECPEMRECRPWTYQVDLYGLAGTVYILLFGKYMEVLPATSISGDGGKSNGSGIGGGIGIGRARKTYRIKDSLKRYWERDIWSDVFDLCLNPTSEKWAQVEKHAAIDSQEPEDEHSSAFSDEFSNGKNSSSTSTLPVLHSMKSVRERMEVWLMANAEKKGLQNHLKKLDNLIGKKR